MMSGCARFGASRGCLRGCVGRRGGLRWLSSSGHGRSRAHTPRACRCGKSPRRGLGPTRVHRIVHEADLNGLEAAVGELRSLYGWAAPEDPDEPGDEELAVREVIADRLQDEV